MSLKAFVMFGMAVGSTIGSYVPVIFGADMLSAWSIVGSFAGGIAGIWGGYALGKNYF